MNLLGRFRAYLQRFMSGRYGTLDSLNLTLMFLYLLFAFIQLFARSAVLYILAMLPLLAFLFRMLSRNLAARQRDNEKFLEFSAPVRKILRKYSRRLRDRKIYRYYSCPTCHRELRVPKGRGKIQITCPHCHHQFEAKS